jgi:hypothetical protein
LSPAIQRLRAEIRFDREAFFKRVTELESIGSSRDAASAPGRAQAAVALHHADGSIESIMVRVAGQLEGDAPGGPGWHQALLHAIGLDVESVRPAVFSQETVAVLGRLLGCRHFFRHAYAVERDAERLKILRGEIVTAAPRILDELQRLDRFLAQVAEAEPAHLPSAQASVRRAVRACAHSKDPLLDVRG